LVGNEQTGNQQGWTPKARILATALSGADPTMACESRQTPMVRLLASADWLDSLPWLALRPVQGRTRIPGCLSPALAWVEAHLDMTSLHLQY
jgi:hypothetical protein